MQRIFIFILLITLAYTQIALSFERNDNVQNENKIGPISSLVPLREQTNTPECLSKTQLLQILNRDRRASISRAYFNHWRQTRDNRRYTVKNSLAFSPRLGKRAYENANELDNADETSVYRSIDLDSFLVTFAGQLQEKQIDIVYEDPTEICLSQPISDLFIQQVRDQIDRSRRNPDEQEKEKTRGRQTIGKHPVLFRYRLGK